MAIMCPLPIKLSVIWGHLEHSLSIQSTIAVHMEDFHMSQCSCVLSVFVHDILHHFFNPHILHIKVSLLVMLSTTLKTGSRGAFQSE